MKKLLTTLFGVFGVTNAFANPACAVCTVAIGATLSISRRLGVCDNAIAIWVGAFLVLMGYWLIKWFDKKNWHFWGRNVILMLLSFSVIGGLYIHHLNYNPCFWFLDSFMIYALVGGAIYILSQKLYEWMKRRNGGHAHFPFEKVVLAIGALLVASIIVAQFA
ncbi:MAG: hypothetical protein IJR92_00520 [Alphaproteobacteria bacterium]|nr:hypothetical protein [Alphaproteobacteria bacterium]